MRQRLPRQLEKLLDTALWLQFGMEQNKALFRALRLERVVTFIMIGLIVFVAR